MEAEGGDLDRRVIVLCHDDSLIFRGQKHEVGLEAEWRRVVPRTGEITGYFNTMTQETAKEYQDGEGWVPVSPRLAKLAEEVQVYAKDAYIDIRMNNLWNDMRKRYTVSLDALIATTVAGIVAYKGKEATGRELARPRTEAEKMKESLRLRFKKYWRAVAYEHNVLIPRDIGLKMIEELRAVDMAGGKYLNTVYTKGFTSKEGLKVKVYDMAGRHGQDSVKIEVTLRQDFLERHELKNPATWETQPDIQEKLESTLKREWRIVFSKAGGARAMLAERLGVRQGDLFEFMADTKNTLMEVRADIEAIKAKALEHDRRLEALELDRKRKE